MRRFSVRLRDGTVFTATTDGEDPQLPPTNYDGWVVVGTTTFSAQEVVVVAEMAGVPEGAVA